MATQQQVPALVTLVDSQVTRLAVKQARTPTGVKALGGGSRLSYFHAKTMLGTFQHPEDTSWCLPLHFGLFAVSSRAIAQLLTYLATTLENLTDKGLLPFLRLSYSRPRHFSPVPASITTRLQLSPVAGSTVRHRLKEASGPIIPLRWITPKSIGLTNFEMQRLR